MVRNAGPFVPQGRLKIGLYRGMGLRALARGLGWELLGYLGRNSSRGGKWGLNWNRSRRERRRGEEVIAVFLDVSTDDSAPTVGAEGVDVFVLGDGWFVRGG